jgi:peroxiredoxin
MSRQLQIGLVAVAACLALAAGFLVSQRLRQAEPPEAGAALVDFALPDLAGKPRWLSEWQGKTIVLNFWATWCLPCKEEMPLLMEVHTRYQERGVVVVGVALDTPDAVRQFAHDFKIRYPLLVADENGLDLMARYGNSRGALPYTVVLGSDGAVAAKKLGAFRGHELHSLVEGLVTTEATTILPK